MRYIVTNFAYGTGPLIRVLELALAINKRREREGLPRFGIIIPLVHGDKTRKLLREQFPHETAAHPNEFLLSKELGHQLQQLFYSGEKFTFYLTRWIRQSNRVERKIKKFLNHPFSVQTLNGKNVMIDNNDIAFELARSPRVAFGLPQAYSTSFCHLSDLYRASAPLINKKIRSLAIKRAVKIERSYAAHFMATPGTFASPRTTYRSQFTVPPLINPLPKDTSPISPGIYVSATGIPNLTRLFKGINTSGLTIYANKAEICGSKNLRQPSIITNPKIKFQFARTGWGAAWLSLIHEKPLLFPAFDQHDDPEIYFNNRRLEQLGFGKECGAGEIRISSKELAAFRSHLKKLNRALKRRFKTLNGNDVCAGIINKLSKKYT